MVSVNEFRSAATYRSTFPRLMPHLRLSGLDAASRLPPKRLLGCVALCGAADLLGVCDVKDLMGSTLLSASPGSDFSVQPRIPEAA